MPSNKSDLKKLFLVFSLLPAIFLVLKPSSSSAGMGTSLMQTASVVEPGKFELKAQGDIIFNNGGGFNISPHIVTGLIDHLVDVDAYFGTGTTDFQIGALGKYNFMPDIEQQLALSFLGGFSILKDGNGTTSSTGALFTTGILVSKETKTTIGQLTPYAAFELEFFFINGNSTVPMTLIAGSKWFLEDVRPWRFYTEISISLNDSLSSLALGAAYPF